MDDEAQERQDLDKRRCAYPLKLHTLHLASLVLAAVPTLDLAAGDDEAEEREEPGQQARRPGGRRLLCGQAAKQGRGAAQEEAAIAGACSWLGPAGAHPTALRCQKIGWWLQ